jgi:hypothetical protein
MNEFFKIEKKDIERPLMTREQKGAVVAERSNSSNSGID